MKLLLLRSSNCDVRINARGTPVRRPKVWSDIIRFDLAEFRRWERKHGLKPDLDETDVLLLGYWCKDEHGATLYIGPSILQREHVLSVHRGETK